MFRGKDDYYVSKLPPKRSKLFTRVISPDSYLQQLPGSKDLGNCAYNALVTMGLISRQNAVYSQRGKRLSTGVCSLPNKNVLKYLNKISTNTIFANLVRLPKDIIAKMDKISVIHEYLKNKLKVNEITLIEYGAKKDSKIFKHISTIWKNKNNEILVIELQSLKVSDFIRYFYSRAPYLIYLNLFYSIGPEESLNVSSKHSKVQIKGSIPLVKKLTKSKSSNYLNFNPTTPPDEWVDPLLGLSSPSSSSKNNLKGKQNLYKGKGLRKRKTKKRVKKSLKNN